MPPQKMVLLPESEASPTWERLVEACEGDPHRYVRKLIAGWVSGMEREGVDVDATVGAAVEQLLRCSRLPGSKWDPTRYELSSWVKTVAISSVRTELRANKVRPWFRSLNYAELPHQRTEPRTIPPIEALPIVLDQFVREGQFTTRTIESVWKVMREDDVRWRDPGPIPPKELARARRLLWQQVE